MLFLAILVITLIQGTKPPPEGTNGKAVCPKYWHTGYTDPPLRLKGSSPLVQFTVFNLNSKSRFIHTISPNVKV